MHGHGMSQRPVNSLPQANAELMAQAMKTLARLLARRAATELAHASLDQEGMTQAEQDTDPTLPAADGP